MKRLAVAALFASGLAFTAIAQTPAAPAAGAPAVTPTGSNKIAVIAFQGAVSQTNEFQRAALELQKKWEPRQQQLKTQGEDVDNQTKQLQAQASTLSEEQRDARARAVEDKRKALERSFEDARNDYQQEVKAIYNTTATKVYDVMSGYAQQNGYTLVLDESAQTSPVLYAIETIDITKAIVDAYNVKSGISAPPPQSAAVPGPAKQAAPRPSTTKPAPQK
jgi:outer membrane protein